MLSVDEYEGICARQRETLAYGVRHRECLCDNATILFIVAGRLNQIVAERRSRSGLSNGLGQACAALARVALTSAWWRDFGETATETEMSERLLLANQHVDNAIKALHRPSNSLSIV